MEEKLAEYRRNAKENFEKTKSESFWKRLFKKEDPTSYGANGPSVSNQKGIHRENNFDARDPNNRADDLPLLHNVPEANISQETSSSVIYSVIFVLWLLLFWFFIYIEFGAVYLIVSILLFIYFNTRTRPKFPGELSAYSVFNKNCTSIDGTLKGEDFDKEIRSGLF